LVISTADGVYFYTPMTGWSHHIIDDRHLEGSIRTTGIRCELHV